MIISLNSIYFSFFANIVKIFKLFISAGLEIKLLFTTSIWIAFLFYKLFRFPFIFILSIIQCTSSLASFAHLPGLRFTSSSAIYLDVTGSTCLRLWPRNLNLLSLRISLIYGLSSETLNSFLLILSYPSYSICRSLSFLVTFLNILW